jgi:protein O-mannosyl-transferase
VARRSRKRPSHRHRQIVPAPPDAAGRRWWRPAVIVVAGLLTYANSLSGAFILDDQGTIVDNLQIREWWRLGTVLFPDAGSSASGRPLVSLSYAINYALGELDVRGYHAWNIAVHLACALTLFGVVRRTLELPIVRQRLAASTNLAFAVALLWALHPLNTETVDYLTQRSESMAALALLLTLYAVIRSATSPLRNRWRLVAVAVCAIGMACKESMAVAPVLMLLFDRAFLADSWSDLFRVRRWLHLGLAATWLLLFALNASGPRSEVVGFSTGVSSWTYLLNQTTMLATYLRLAVWPRSLVVFYGWPVALTLKDVWLPALAVTAFFLVCLAGVVRASRLAFLGAWFFITLAPTSSFVPISTEVGAERRMYLPLMAIVTLAVVAAYAAWRRITRRWPAVSRVSVLFAACTLVVLSVALAGATVARNREYASALTLARTVVERRPTGVAHHILAEQLMLANRHEEAVAHLRDAVALGDSRAGYSLGVELFNAGKLNEAIEQFDKFSRTWRLPYRLVPHWLEPPPADVLAAYLAMGRAYALQGRWPQSAEQAERVLAIAPARLDARRLLADALFGQQRFEEAAGHYRQYLNGQPNDAGALTSFGVTMVAGGQLVEAIAAFRRAVEIEPQNANARKVLGMALLDHGEPAEALEQARRALSLGPDDGTIRELLSRAEAMTRIDSARRRAGQ